MMSFLRREHPLLAILATALLFVAFGHVWLTDYAHPAWSAVIFAWLFCFIIWGAAAVVRHADHLADLLGEPYGTLILTLSVTSIEIVTVAIVMLTGPDNPTLGRDTMFSVVMIVLNGLIGLGLLLGGWRYREQEYNFRGASAYLSVIFSLAVFGLVMPNFTWSTPGGTFSEAQEIFLVVMCLGLYGVFLAIQTTRHRAYFQPPSASEEARHGATEEPAPHAPGSRPSWLYHAALLAAYLALVIKLAEDLGHSLNHGLDDLNAPPALGALVVAVLVLAPEGMGAVRAALANQLQRTVNILLGSVLATLALTFPALLFVSLNRGVSLVLGLDGAQMVMLMLTLLVSTITFASGRSNVLQGAVHLMLFFAYVMLMFWS